MKNWLLLLLSFSLFSFIQSDKVIAKSDKQLAKIFSEVTFAKKEVKLSTEKKDEFWYLINEKETNKTLGFMQTTRGFGKFAHFDFMIIFNPNKSIRKVKVLIYREDHGAEIGSKRWLKQFEGKTAKDAPNREKQVDGISGATLSCNSITKEIKNALVTIQRIN